MTARASADLRDAVQPLLRDYLASYAARLPVRSVVVVGNAPLAPDARRAARIDGSDLVIRMNSFAMDHPGTPPAVGTRCHAVLLSRYAPITPWVLQDYRRRAYLVPQAGYGLRYVLHPQPAFWPADLGTMPVPNDPLVIRLLALLDPDHAPNTLIPTSGILAIYLAHELFPDARVAATGFSYLDGVQRASWTYQGGGGSPVIEAHRLDLESALLGRWIDDGSLEVVE